jgi:diaminohydroxyphosphoribosylaminopyrimidine deaminase/5-amino-6-(5-phosphoribosylamino)uracil reductase
LNTDQFFMDIALQLAKSAHGQTQPNPLVGAVIVNGGQIVGMGAHLKPGEPHAEIYALAMAKEKSKGATIYVTLEPCSHFGRTPPCADALVKAELARVVIAATDPNPLVAGSGIKKLRDSGIEVAVGIREKESLELNEVFNKFIQTRKPFVTIKTASTLDGKMATVTGSSRWVTGQEARGHVHWLRHINQAILVGVQTVIEDDPELTTRLPEGGGRNPIRIILDSTLRIPMEAKVVTDKRAETWIYTTPRQDTEKRLLLEQQGVKVIQLADSEDSQINIHALLTHLGEHHITSLLVEGGSMVNGSFLKAQSIDKVISFIAPKLVGGQSAPTPYGGEGITEMGEAIKLTNIQLEKVGEDVCIIGYPTWL